MLAGQSEIKYLYEVLNTFFGKIGKKDKILCDQKNLGTYLVRIFSSEKPCYLINHVVREQCNQRTDYICITVIGYKVLLQNLLKTFIFRFFSCYLPNQMKNFTLSRLVFYLYLASKGDQNTFYLHISIIKLSQ